MNINRLLLFDKDSLMLHLSQAIELEREIYTLQRFFEFCTKKKITLQMEPVEPKQPDSIPLMRPNSYLPPLPQLDEIKIRDIFHKHSRKVLRIFIGSVSLYFILWISALLSDNPADIRGFKRYAPFVFVIMTITILFSMLYDHYSKEQKRLKNIYDKELEKHNQKREQYERDMANYNHQELMQLEVNRIRAIAYQQDMDTYKKRREEVLAFNENANKVNSFVYALQTAIDTALSPLTEALKDVYGLNMVYGKYRNFVAYSSFYEYFDSGRCEMLTGVDGAYNIFEQEIRMDRIIYRLDIIVLQLNQIQKNQYKLYCELCVANDRIAVLTEEVHAGFVEVSARQNILAYEVDVAANQAGKIAVKIDHLDGYMAELTKLGEKANRYLAEAGSGK